MTTAGPTRDVSIHGVIPPTITAFTDDEELALDAIAAHARFVVDRGVHAVFPLGTNGEFPMLRPDERAAVVDEVGDDVPVIAGVSAPSTRNSSRALFSTSGKRSTAVRTWVASNPRSTSIRTSTSTPPDVPSPLADGRAGGGPTRTDPPHAGPDLREPGRIGLGLRTHPDSP